MFTTLFWELEMVQITLACYSKSMTENTAPTLKTTWTTARTCGRLTDTSILTKPHGQLPRTLLLLFFTFTHFFFKFTRCFLVF